MVPDSPSPSDPHREQPRLYLGDLPLFTVLMLASLVLVIGLAGGRGAGESGSSRGPGDDGTSADARAARWHDGETIERAPVHGVTRPGAGQRVPGPDFAAPLRDRGQGDEAASGDAGGAGESGGPGHSSHDDVSERGPTDDGLGPVRGLGLRGLRERGEYVAGVREGRWEKLWPDGSIESEGEYEAGLREGPWVTYSALGAVLEEAHYAGGSLHGDWRAYAESGSLIGEGQYGENLRSGRWTLYYSDGQVKESGRYVDGLREGSWEFYDDLGHPTVRTGEYRAGIKIN